MWGVWGCAGRSSFNNSTTVSIAAGGGVSKALAFIVCVTETNHQVLTSSEHVFPMPPLSFLSTRR